MLPKIIKLIFLNYYKKTQKWSLTTKKKRSKIKTDWLLKSLFDLKENMGADEFYSPTFITYVIILHF